MNPQAIAKLQASLGLPPTGVFDSATMSAMASAVTKAVSTNKDIAKYAGTNSADAILSAYHSGDWSGITDLTGKPFTDAQQQAAVSQAEAALAPAYKAAEAYDRSVVEDTLGGEQDAFSQFQKDEAKDFGAAKDELDQAAADQGVLFSGSRVQKLRDLRTTAQEREALARGQSAARTRDAARSYQYNYGNEAANNLSSLYRLPTESTFNANVAGGKVTPGKSLASTYSPSEFDFQGIKPVAQKAAVQTRAAGLLANKANKLSLSGYAKQF